MTDRSFPEPSIQAQRAFNRCLERATTGFYDRFYDYSEYDYCWQTMHEVADNESVDIRKKISVAFGLAEIEKVSDDPRKTLHVTTFITELGEEFKAVDAKGILFDFKTRSIDIKATRRDLEKELKRRMFGLATRQWFDRIDHPELDDLRRLFVAKVLRSNFNQGSEWYVDPEGDL